MVHHFETYKIPDDLVVDVLSDLTGRGDRVLGTCRGVVPEPSSKQGWVDRIKCPFIGCIYVQ